MYFANIPSRSNTSLWYVYFLLPTDDYKTCSSDIHVLFLTHIQTVMDFWLAAVCHPYHQPSFIMRQSLAFVFRFFQ